MGRKIKREDEFTYINDIYELNERDCDLALKIQKAARKLDDVSEVFRAQSKRAKNMTSRVSFTLEEAENLHDLDINFRSSTLQELSFMYLKMQEYEVRKKLMMWDKDYSDLLSDEIWVAVSDDKIYARTPRINRTYNHTTIRKGAAYTKNYYSFFAPEVERKLGKVFDEIPDFEERNVNILAVYNNPKDRIPDTLNLDVKTIVDALTGNLPGGDEATVCSFSMASVMSKLLPEGVYFTIENGFAIAPSLKDNIAAIRNVFSQEIVKKSAIYSI